MTYIIRKSKVFNAYLHCTNTCYPFFLISQKNENENDFAVKLLEKLAQIHKLTLIFLVFVEKEMIFCSKPLNYGAVFAYKANA